MHIARTGELEGETVVEPGPTVFEWCGVVFVVYVCACVDVGGIFVRG